MRATKRRRAGGNTSAAQQLITAAALLTSHRRARPVTEDPLTSLRNALATHSLPGVCPGCRVDSQMDGVVQCGSCERWSPAPSCSLRLHCGVVGAISLVQASKVPQRCSRYLRRRSTGCAHSAMITASGTYSSGVPKVAIAHSHWQPLTCSHSTIWTARAAAGRSDSVR